MAVYGKGGLKRKGLDWSVRFMCSEIVARVYLTFATS